jgi:hypothetical protein
LKLKVPKKTVVFLHIPKTAGQTIHSELERKIGTQNISPVRVHTQVNNGADQYPRGYKAYSGHLDWDCLSVVPKDKFVFTVLRDPLERLASFYLYLREKSEYMNKDNLKLPQNKGLQMIRECSADEYFLHEDPGWQGFIKNHYYNPYCSYLITRKMNGYNLIKGLFDIDLVDAAIQNIKEMSKIYSTKNLSDLEDDLMNYCGLKVSLKNKKINIGPKLDKKDRWSQLTNLFENKTTAPKLIKYVEADQKLMKRLKFN